MIEGAELLLVGAEVSVTLAGFAGVLAAFQFRSVESVSRPDLAGLTTIVQNSLWCAFGCVLPVLLATFRIESSLLWAISSAFAVLLMTGLIVSTVIRLRGSVRRTAVKVFFGMLQLGSALFVVVNIMNAAGFFFDREPGPYLAAIVWGLSLAGYMFVRLLLRPLWRLIREQEADAA